MTIGRVLAILVASGTLWMTTDAVHAEDSAVFSEEYWERTAVLDGTVAAEFPCLEGDLRGREEGAQSVVACLSGGLAFVIMRGLPFEESPWGSGDFDTILDSAQRDTEFEGTLKLDEVSGLRALTIGNPDSDPVRVARIIETDSVNPMVVMAMERPEGGIDLARRPEAIARAQRFVGSVEVLAR